MAERAGWWPAAADAVDPPDVDFTTPNMARVYDYVLGGKDNFAVDRAVGDEILRRLPEVRLGVQQQRALLRRAVRLMVEDLGIRQLIDIGAGLPTADNVHEIARRHAPGTRVVYVDNDPVVLAHGRAILADAPEVCVVEGDITRPEEILAHPQTRGLIDLTEPVGLVLCGILHHVSEEEGPQDLVRRLCAPLPVGSHVLLHHLRDPGSAAAAELQQAFRAATGRGEFRSDARVASLLDGLDLLEPGLVPVCRWRPDHEVPESDEHPVLQLALAALARKSRPTLP
ncbi:SAM-dependent methyltransferase [Lipingzhangella sp. LS1_29]|uniref:SAM-dependent methyltransferase n=1 Tax=Lipingzhangella rawalii TaxID=2055835 RepID=A0ABU2H859_9ACTN|nr:SAM-dependent methyltransferase [Lipingzhangella rawalii]MDS1271025.1 SAM-dependent methyltransferase [Lipingzhangella rawalii]